MWSKSNNLRCVTHNLAKLCPCYVTLWPWPFTPWPWKRVLDWLSCDKTMYERDRSTRGWVIDDLAHFRCPILDDGALSPDGSQGCMDQTLPNLEWYRAMINKFVSEFRYLCSFRNAGGSRVEWCRSITPNFALFAPPVKIRGGVGGDVWVKKSNFTYDWTSGIHLIGVLCADVESCVTVKFNSVV